MGLASFGTFLGGRALPGSSERHPWVTAAARSGSSDQPPCTLAPADFPPHYEALPSRASPRPQGSSLRLSTQGGAPHVLAGRFLALGGSLEGSGSSVALVTKVAGAQGTRGTPWVCQFSLSLFWAT